MFGPIPMDALIYKCFSVIFDKHTINIKMLSVIFYQEM